MEYFIGIAPPTEYGQRIAAFQRRWRANGLPSVVEPHITIKAQGDLDADLVWVDKVRALCSVFPDFPLSIVEARLFGDSVAYLGIESERIFELHRRLVQDIGPSTEFIQRYFEGDLYTPHLTLGQIMWGMTASALENMHHEADNILHLFPVFYVTYVTIYQSVHPDRYEPFQDIPLMSSSK